MKVDLMIVIYWLLLPLINFVFWFYTSKTNLWAFHCASNPTVPLSDAADATMVAMLEKSLQELQAETLSQPCSVERQRPLEPQCNHRVPAEEGEFFVTFENTERFDQYRQERLASMTLNIVLKTYTDADTMVLHYRGRKDQRQGGRGDDSCISLDHHFLDADPSSCMAVVYSSNTNISYDIARVDLDIDIYGLSISNPDPSQIDKYSTKFALNVHNQNKLWPTGFFRKVPKERGRIRTKEKLGTFLIYFDRMERELQQKLHDHNIQRGDDLVVMVLNEGELDLFLNFACSCKLHGISLHNILVFAGSR